MPQAMIDLLQQYIANPLICDTIERQGQERLYGIHIIGRVSLLIAGRTKRKNTGSEK